jgi:two-component system chemotaxis response regulator CheB
MKHLLHPNIIVIGASMGGFQALRQIISELPEDLTASIFIVLHIPSDHESLLTELYARNSKLPVVSAKDKDLIKPGHIYIAVPDYHLQFDGNHIHLDHGPKHNFHRPAVDTLFISAAKEFGPRVVGVVLSGALDDGTAGLMEVKRHGGVSIIQDPKDAVNPSMPQSARDCVPIDHCVPISEMAALLAKVSGHPILASSIRDGKRVPKPSEPELSPHICPECNGPMWFVETGKALHYHCRIGHAFSGQSLLVVKTTALESALWSAVNALKDKSNIATKLSKRANEGTVKRKNNNYFRKQAESADHYAKVITDILLKPSSPTAVSSKKPKQTSAVLIKKSTPPRPSRSL